MLKKKILLFAFFSIVVATFFAQEAVVKASIHREKAEWLDMWVENGNAFKQSSRVLLIGDSITKNYYTDVKRELKQKAIVDKLATSKSVCDPAFLDEVKLVLSYYQYDVIHFNNGLHGWDYSEDQYKAAMVKFVEVLNEFAPNSRLIWAQTTPCQGSWRSKNPRIKQRNNFAQEALASRLSSVDDLYGVVKGKVCYYLGDGIHYNREGVRKQVFSVVTSIKKQLKELGE